MASNPNPAAAVDAIVAAVAARSAELLAHPEQLISLGARLGRIAAEKGDRVAVTFEHGSSHGNEEAPDTITWTALHRRSNRIARGLLAKGVKQGDLVTLALPNSIDFIAVCYGLWKMGATPQPVSARLPQAELQAIVELARSPIVIGAAVEAGRPSIGVDELVALATEDSDLPEIFSPSWKAPTSGGSTGRPKLIVAGAPAAATGVMSILWRIGPDDRVLMPGPLYHNGPFITIFAALEAGASVVLMPKFDAERTLALIHEHRISWIYTVPTMLGRMLRLPDAVKAQYDIGSLKTLWHLAAPCPPWLKQAWIDWIGADAVLELYGGTEGVAFTILDGNEWLLHRGSVGRVVGAAEIAAFAPDGRRLPAGETGEIFMRAAPGAAPSYRYLGAESQVLEGGWETIGDIGWLDADGYLYLADRRTDMILVGGANVYPAEVEAAIDDHPLVQSSCVIGLPDDDLGNRVHAIVQAREGLTEAALLAHLAQRLVLYKRPRSIEFSTEPLRDDAGKVRRSQLREQRLSKPG